MMIAVNKNLSVATGRTADLVAQAWLASVLQAASLALANKGTWRVRFVIGGKEFVFRNAIQIDPVRRVRLMVRRTRVLLMCHARAAMTGARGSPVMIA